MLSKLLSKRIFPTNVVDIGRDGIQTPDGNLPSQVGQLRSRFCHRNLRPNVTLEWAVREKKLCLIFDSDEIMMEWKVFAHQTTLRLPKLLKTKLKVSANSRKWKPPRKISSSWWEDRTTAVERWSSVCLCPCSTATFLFHRPHLQIRPGFATFRHTKLTLCKEQN